MGFLKLIRVLVFLLALATIALPRLGVAQTAPMPDPTGDTTEFSDPGTEDSVLGKVGAVGCGLGLRLCRVTGPNAGAIMITVSFCLLMIVDGLATSH